MTTPRAAVAFPTFAAGVIVGLVVAVLAVVADLGGVPGLQSIVLRAAEPPKTAPATHVTQADIEAFIAQLPRGRISDNPIRAVDVGGYRVGVFAVFRPKDSPQDAIYHDTNMTEILYIIRGSANLITGGTIPDARPPQRTGGNYTGTRIDGGTTRHVVPGDVIITPGRTPHLWADIESDMSYLVFRPDPENTLTLK